MNKKGEDIGNVILFLYIIGLITSLGVIIALAVVVIDFATDTIVPEISNLGVIGDANLTDYARYTIHPANVFLQQLMWMGGFMYLLGFVGILGLAFAFRFTGNKWFLGFFVVAMLLVVMISMLIANIYEDFYNDGGDIGVRMREQTLLSFLMMNAPIVITIIGFIGGIIMFTGDTEEVYA